MVLDVVILDQSMKVSITEGNRFKDLIMLSWARQPNTTTHTSQEKPIMAYSLDTSVSFFDFYNPKPKRIKTKKAIKVKQTFHIKSRKPLNKRKNRPLKRSRVHVKSHDLRKLLRIATELNIDLVKQQEKYLVKPTETPFVPHIGTEQDSSFMLGFNQVIAALSARTGQRISDGLLAEFEGIAALFVALRGTVDYTSALATVILYLRKFSDKAVTTQVLQYFKEAFLPQAGNEDPTIAKADWLAMMKNIYTNWTQVKNNKFFGHLSKLMGVLITMEMCKASSLTFSIKDMKLFEPDMKVIHGNAIDVIDAALGSVSFFVDVLSLCWDKKSLRPLLVSDQAALELDFEYAEICSYWELVKNGNLMRFKGITDHEFDRRLEKLATSVNALLPSLRAFDKKLMNDKYMKLLFIKNDYIGLKISSGTRAAPFAIELFGSSSQGKSTIAEQLISAMLTSADWPTDKEFQATYNASDKYMSTWTTDKLVMLIDDVANEKSNFVERPPTRPIIDICNNMPFYANMADLNSKGKIFVEPKIVVVTTNVKDLDARVYSNNPYSIQRRMHIVITVKAKKEFQRIDSNGKCMGINSSLVDASYPKGEQPLFDDIWELTLEHAVPPQDISCQAGYEPFVHNDKPLINVSFKEALNFVIEQHQLHIIAQNNILERMRKRENLATKCNIDGCCQIKGYCATHEKLEPQWGEAIMSNIFNVGKSAISKVSDDIIGSGAAVEALASIAILRAGREFAKRWDWINFVPTPWVENTYFQYMCMASSYESLRWSYIRHSCLNWGLAGMASTCCWRKGKTQFAICATSTLVGCLALQKNMVKTIERKYRNDLLSRNTVGTIIGEMRDKHVSNICKAGGIVAVLYGFSRVYKAWRQTFRVEAHGSLEPKTQMEIDLRDQESNQWTEIVERSLPVQGIAKNTTAKQLKGLVATNLMYGTVICKEGTMAVNCMFVRTNVMLIPQHYFDQEELKITFRKEDPLKGGGMFAAKLSKSMSYFIPDTDLALCYVPSGGSMKLLSRFLPSGEVNRSEFLFMHRNMDGTMIEAQGLGKYCNTGHTNKSFRGIEYDGLTIDTKPGMCGSVLLSKTRPVILGYHLGGQTGTPRGCAGILTLERYKEGLAFLRAQEGVLVTGTAEHFDKEVMGVTILTGKPCHDKSPLRYQPHNSQIEWFGTCPGHSTFKSQGIKTKITKHVEDVMGAPNIYNTPTESPQWMGWQICLHNMATPAIPYNPEILAAAVVDYKSGLSEIFGSDLWKNSRPLYDYENWNGVPGRKFLDRVKANTSVGFPLKGKKEIYLEEIELFGAYTKVVQPTPIIQNEIDRMSGCYKREERGYPIAKACKKDEILTKDKCRIFYSNPVALTFLIRKYFLPLLRVLQFNPKMSECAVGVNSHGPEWNELYEHVLTYGEDRLFGGDYGKYDQKLSSQLLLASLRVLIDFARCCDYSEEDLRVMETMSGDLVYAVIAYNGDLIGLTEGTHISGNSLTVILNGICGSLNMRCYYLSHPRKVPFRDAVKLMTYGDDNIGSVRKDIDNFTIKGASEYLAEYGQIYTMPDKESALLDFLPFEQFEFLKRFSVFHPKLGCHVGALVDKSCYKMLHYYLRDKSPEHSEELACAMNIDTACSEWFNHGEEIYENRREELREVAKRAEISHLCMNLDKTYNDKVLIWKDKYA